MTTDTITAKQQRYIISTENGVVREIATKKFPRFFTDTDLEDIAGNAIYKACRSIGSFNPSKGTFYTWLRRIGTNAVLDEAFRKGTKDTTYVEELVRCDDEDDSYVWDRVTYRSNDFTPDKRIESEEFYECWSKCTASLSDKDKRYLDHLDKGLKPKEIAEIEGCTTSAASMRKFHIQQKLRPSAAKLADEYDIYNSKLAS